MINIRAMHSVFALNELRTEKQRKINRFRRQTVVSKTAICPVAANVFSRTISPEIHFEACFHASGSLSGLLLHFRLTFCELNL